MDFAKTMTILSNPQGMREAFIIFLAANGIEIEKSKSFGGIVNYHQLTLATGVNEFFNGVAPAAPASNLDDFVRKQGEYFIVTDMRYQEGVNAAGAGGLNSTVWVPGAADAQTLNALFSYVNNGIRTIDRIPLGVCTRAVENPYSGYWALPFFNLWSGQEKLEVNVSLFAAPAADTHGRVELHGLGLVA